MFFFMLLLLMGWQAQAQDIDSLYAVFSASRGGTRISAANEIMKYVYVNGYFDPLITLKTTDDEAFILAAVYDAMGGYFGFEKEHFVKSTEFYKLALVNYEKIGDEESFNLINGNIGSNYARTGDYEHAAAYLMKCYEWEKGAGNSEGLGSTLNNLGVVYSQWDKPEMAIRFFEEAERVERPLNRPMNYANRLAQLAIEYSKINGAPKALQLIKEALQYDEKIESQTLKEERIAAHYATMGDIYYRLDSLDNAANCYRKAFVFYEKKGQPFKTAATLLQLGRLQLKAQQYGKAIASLQQCEQIAKENSYLAIQLNACRLLSETYHTFDPKSTMSYVYLNKYTILNDSVFKATAQQQMNDFQVRYQTAEKQIEIERQQSEISRHRTRQFIYIVIIVAFGLLLLMSTALVVQRNRRNRILVETNALKDKFFSIISHDLKNPAISQRAALQTLLDNVGQWDTQALRKYYKGLLTAADHLVDLLYNLLHWAHVQTGRMPYSPSTFDLSASLKTDLSLLQYMADVKNIRLNIQLPQHALVSGDSDMLVTVVRNIVTNALKFTPDGGFVTLLVTPSINEARSMSKAEERGSTAESTKYTVSITDTGTGMSAEQMLNLFSNDRASSLAGVAGRQRRGLGLVISREFLEKHGSRLHVESQEGEGSRFWFEV